MGDGLEAADQAPGDGRGVAPGEDMEQNQLQQLLVVQAVHALLRKLRAQPRAVAGMVGHGGCLPSFFYGRSRLRYCPV